MSPTFRVDALPAADLDRIRARGVDDHGNPLVVTTAGHDEDVPLRCCLRNAAAGERYALLAWQPAAIGGAYAEVGPVFVHAETCGGHHETGYPAAFRHRRQLLRAYDGEGRQLDNQLVEGSDAETGIGALFARRDVAYLHSRNPLAGCYMFAVTR